MVAWGLGRKAERIPTLPMLAPMRLTSASAALGAWQWPTQLATVLALNLVFETGPLMFVLRRHLVAPPDLACYRSALRCRCCSQLSVAGRLVAGLERSAAAASDARAARAGHAAVRAVRHEADPRGHAAAESRECAPGRTARTPRHDRRVDRCPHPPCAARGGAPARIDQAGAGRSEVAVPVLDLDHFKAVNDRLGHAAGDLMPRLAGRSLQDQLRADAVLARWAANSWR